MNYLFLLLTLGATLLIAFFARRFDASRTWKPMFVAVVVGGLSNVLLACAFYALNVLKFAPKYLSTPDVGFVPIEQIMLSFVLPYAFLAIYSYLNAAHPLVKADKYSLSVSNLIIGLSLAMIFFAYNKLFAVITFSLLLITLFYVEYKTRLRFMLQFYRSYGLALLPFLLIFIPLNLLSIYKYTLEQTIELKIAYIPFESYFYFLWSCLITTTFYELFKRRA
jgi:energy-converting hydrogenase Eha subunit E